MQRVSSLASKATSKDIFPIPTVIEAYATPCDSRDLYVYTLRLLILEYINEPRFQEKLFSRIPSGSSQQQVTGSEKHSRRASWFSSSYVPVKEPSEFEILQTTLPKLEKYLRRVMLSKIKLSNDKLRRSFLKFYNDLFLNPTMGQTLKSMQRFEELIIYFTKAANGELNKLVVDSIQKELYREVSYFIDVLIELASDDMTNELKERLKEYKDSVKPSKASLKKFTSYSSTESAASSSTVLSSVKPTFRLEEITHSVYFMELFQKNEVNLQQDIIKTMSDSQNHVFCQELLQRKEDLGNGKGMYRAGDFVSEKYYELWRNYESVEIASLLDKFDSKSEAIEKCEVSSMIIPKKPREMFINLLVKVFKIESSHCLDSLGMSQTGLFFLTKASKYWGVDYHSTLASLAYTAANLSILKDEEVNMKLAENVFNFINTKILKFEDNMNTAVWNDLDQKMWLVNLFHSAKQCFNSIDNLLTAVYTNTKPKFSNILSFYYTYIESDPAMMLFKKHSKFNNGKTIKMLRKTIFCTSEQYYISLLDQVPKDSSIEIQHIQNIAELIIEQIKSIQKRYSKLLLDEINLSFECATTLIEAFASDVPTMIKRVEKYSKAKRGVKVAPVDALEAYSIMKEMSEIYQQVQPEKTFPFNVEKIFSSYLVELCNEVCAKIPKVIETSIESENWEPINPQFNFSASVVDIFKMINESINMFKKLHWADRYENARVVTVLLKSFSDGIRIYATTLLRIIEDDLMQDASELLINEDSDNKENIDTGRLSAEKLRAWSFTDMKNALRASNILQAPKPYQFKPRTCVLLNNLESMIQKVNDLDEQIKAEQLSEVIQKYEHRELSKGPLPKGSNQTLYQIYTMRIIGAENIKGFRTDGLSNTFVSLMDTTKHREIGKTKLYPKSINPIWDEEFEIEIPVDRSRSIALTVWHRPLGKLLHLGNYDICGKCSIILDRKKFTDDGFPNEAILDLDSQGKLCLEVSLESEKMDPLFCIGRAYRTLARGRDRAIELIINKFLSFVNYAFSRATLKTVCGPNGTTPAPNDVTYDAIVPLFDYLNSNLNILASILSQESLFRVMLRAWSCILKAADALLLPQLSMAKHKRLSGTKFRWENAVSTALGNAPTVSGYGRALTQREIETIFVWLNALCVDFFHNNGEGPPLSDLKNKHYQTILLIPAFFDKTTIELKKEVELLSPEYTKYLKHITVANTNSRKLSVRLTTLRRRGTIMANASKKRRSKVRRQIEQDENDPLERNADMLDVLLRTLIAKGEIDYVHKHLSARTKAKKIVATEILVKAAVKGQKIKRPH